MNAGVIEAFKAVKLPNKLLESPDALAASEFRLSVYVSASEVSRMRSVSRRCHPRPSAVDISAAVASSLRNAFLRLPPRSASVKPTTASVPMSAPSE